MAYNKHPLKASESHYNKPALVTILLIFLGILVLVAVRQLSPELGASLGITSTAEASPVVVPKTAPVAVETKVTQSPNIKKQIPKAAENTPSTQGADGVSCTEKYISAGLCK
jgi:hypothetical protein